MPPEASRLTACVGGTSIEGMRRIADIVVVLSFVVTTFLACGGDVEDGITINCEPVEAGAPGCTGLPRGHDAGTPPATYPNACGAVVRSGGKSEHWVCYASENRWLLPL